VYRAVLAFVISVAIAAGCDVIAVSCTDEIRPGINVFVLDSATNDTIRGIPITASATSGSFTETYTFAQPQQAYFSYALARERPAVYRVQISAPGYEAWVKDNIEVNSDRCHVRTFEITARLRRLTS
jgi:hypothetical protein